MNFFRRDNAAQAVLDAIEQSLAMIEFDAQGTILRANKNFCAVMGYTAAEVAGQKHSLFVGEAYARSDDYRAFWDKLRRGESVSRQFERLAKGGRKVWVQASYNPVSDENGRVVKVVKVATDISARVNAVTVIGSALSDLAAGKLDRRIGEAFSEDLEKIRTDFNQAGEALQRAISGVAESTHGISNTATEIGSATDGLCHRTEQQAASLEQTAAALEEITGIVKKSAENARAVGAIVTSARCSADESSAVVEAAIDAMNLIEQSSKQITDIIGVIDEIAFQTNLLALNAGVEAARAGEAGKGFAVVAAEVRALAGRSSEAAKKIKILIQSSSDHVATGVNEVGQTGAALKRIAEQVAEAHSLVGEMVQAAQQQATGVSEVNAAVTQLDDVTQRNAAMVEQVTAAARSLTQEADQLTRLIAYFSLNARPQLRAVKGGKA
jgi:methyl-accepting chemotaxis protein